MEFFLLQKRSLSFTLTLFPYFFLGSAVAGLKEKRERAKFFLKKKLQTTRTCAAAASAAQDEKMWKNFMHWKRAFRKSAIKCIRCMLFLCTSHMCANIHALTECLCRCSLILFSLSLLHICTQRKTANYWDRVRRQMCVCGTIMQCENFTFRGFDIKFYRSTCAGWYHIKAVKKNLSFRKSKMSRTESWETSTHEKVSFSQTVAVFSKTARSKAARSMEWRIIKFSLIQNVHAAWLWRSLNKKEHITELGNH